LPDPLVVMCAGTTWDGVASPDRMLASSLATHAEILWVDPPVSAGTPTQFRSGLSRLGVTPRLTTLTGRITRLTPRALPYLTRPGVKITTAALVRAQTRWALRRMGRSPAAVVACNLVDVLRGWGPGVRRVFYGTDDFVAGAALMNQNQASVIRDERRQLANADIVIAISSVLQARWRRLGGRQVVLIPNGVQVAPYADIDARTPAPEAAALPGPVVGVLGNLTQRIDIAILEAIVDEGLSLLLVGPVEPRWEPVRFAALTARPNVVWTGQQPFEAVPSFLRAVDVGATPYLDTEFNRACFPLKTLEYLAAGRPAVSTDLPAVTWLETDLVRVASDAKEFVAAVREAATEARDPQLAAARRALAARHSWDNRAAEVAKAIGLTPAG
jgi:teichuronic acid biosynthesis glycosyltransferase TuaH